MNLLERFIVWLTTKRPEPIAPLAHLMTQARRAQYDERYEESHTFLAQALPLAQAEGQQTVLVDITLSQADNYLYTGRYEEAEKLIMELRQRVETSNHRAPLAYALCSTGILAELRGQIDSARQAYERALKVARSVRAQGAEARAEAHLADIYLSEGNANYAVHLLRTALPRMEQSGDTELLPHFLLSLSRAQQVLGNTPEAAKTLAEAISKATEMQHRRYLREARLLLGDQAFAAQEYSRARSEYEAALALFPAALHTTPQRVQALIQLSRVFILQGEPAAALEQAQHALALAQTNADAAQVALAQAVVGQALVVLQRPAEAQPHLTAAAAFYGTAAHDRRLYFDILMAQATMSAALGTPEQAQRLYQQIIDAALQYQQYEAAAAACSASGQLYESTRTLDQAFKQYSEALQYVDQINAHGQAALLHCHLARVHEHLGQGRRALKDYEQALTRLGLVHDPPTRGAVLIEVARAYMDYGDMDSAEGFFTQAIDYAAQSGDKAAEAARRTHYGHFLVAVGDVRPAITSFMEARSYSQTHDLRLLSAIQADGLALAYRILHDYAQAQYHHDEAFDLIAGAQQPDWQAIFALHQAETLLLQVKLEVNRARGHYQQALDLAEAHRYPTLTVLARVGLALIAQREHKLDAAAAWLDAATVAAEQSYSRRVRAQLRLAQSQQTALQGDLPAARQHWEEAEKFMRALRMPLPKPVWLASS